MEEAGGTPEPEDDESATAGRAFLVVGIVALVALVGLVAWVARGDDVVETVGRAEQRFPPDTTAAVDTTIGATAPPTTAPATPAPTAAPPSGPPTTVEATGPPTEAPAASPSGSTPAATDGSTPPPSTAPTGPLITELVPNVAAFAESLATPQAVRTQIELLLGAPRHDVASAGDVSSLCAVVALDGPLAAEGRWERDGRSVSTTDLTDHDAPGFGDCVGNGGELLEAGSYQYIAIDGDGRESAAGGFVVGAPRVDQRFTNNGDEPVCGVRIAPRTSRYFEAYVFDARPIAPGADVTLPIAGVDQDVETLPCRKGEVLASFDLEPDRDEVQELRP